MSETKVEWILTSYDFPKRFLTYFASQCAKDALSKTEIVDERSRAAVDVAERYGNGEEFTQQFLEDTANAASYDATSSAAAYSSAYSSSNATYSAYSSSAAYYSAATSAAAHASSASSASSGSPNYRVVSSCASCAVYATSAENRNPDHYKPLLLQLIRDRMSKVEQLLTFGEEV